MTVFRHTMGPCDLLEIGLNNIGSIVRLVIRDKASHSRESVHYHHNYIFLPLSSREGYNEIHTQITPRFHRHRQWGVQVLMELIFGLVTYGTSHNHLVNINSHIRPIEVLFGDVNILV